MTKKLISFALVFAFAISVFAMPSLATAATTAAAPAIAAAPAAPVKAATATAATTPMAAVAVAAAATAIAAPTASTVLVNGDIIAYNAYLIDGYNYFKLRDLAYTLTGTEKQFEVGWDEANNAISLISGQSYTVVGGEMIGNGENANDAGATKDAAPTDSRIYLNGLVVRFTAYHIDGNNYFKLRDIGEAIDFGVDWDDERNTIVIDTGKGYTADGGAATDSPIPSPIPTPTPAEGSLPDATPEPAPTATAAPTPATVPVSLMPMDAPIVINGYKTSIIRCEIGTIMFDEQARHGRMFIIIDFDPGNSAYASDEQMQLSRDGLLVTKNGAKYYSVGGGLTPGDHLRVYYHIPISAGNSGHSFEYNGQTWALPEVIPGKMPDMPLVETYPDWLKISRSGDDYYQWQSVSASYLANATYRLYVGDYTGPLEVEATIAPASNVGGKAARVYTASENSEYVTITCHFNIETGYAGSVTNTVTIKIGDYVFTDSIATLGTLTNLKLM